LYSIHNALLKGEDENQVGGIFAVIGFYMLFIMGDDVAFSAFLLSVWCFYAVSEAKSRKREREKS